MKRLRGRYALVTGAASGIGRAIALELAAAGAHLYLVDVDVQPLEQAAETVRRCGVQAITRVCDVGDPRQVAACVEHLQEQWGRLHVLVNNAGILYYGHTERMTVEQW